MERSSCGYGTDWIKSFDTSWGGSYHVHSCHLMKISDAEPSGCDGNGSAAEDGVETEDVHGSDAEEEDESVLLLPRSNLPSSKHICC